MATPTPCRQAFDKAFGYDQLDERQRLMVDASNWPLWERAWTAAKQEGVTPTGNPPPEWAVTVAEGQVLLRIGVQHFRLAYDPEPEPNWSREQALDWMALQLQRALATLASPGPAPRPVRPPSLTLDRRWRLARDGFGLERDDENGNYVSFDDAIALLHRVLQDPALPA